MVYPAHVILATAAPPASRLPTCATGNHSVSALLAAHQAGLSFCARPGIAVTLSGSQADTAGNTPVIAEIHFARQILISWAGERLGGRGNRFPGAVRPANLFSLVNKWFPPGSGLLFAKQRLQVSPHWRGVWCTVPGTRAARPAARRAGPTIGPAPSHRCQLRFYLRTERWWADRTCCHLCRDANMTGEHVR